MRLNFISIVLLFTGCSSQEESIIKEKRFTSVPSSHSGIDFRNDVDDLAKYTPHNTYYIYNGGGVAVGDIDNDGLEDLLFSSNQNGCKLYKNLGDFRFKDITEKASLSYPASWTTGVSMVDINGDGWLDIHVCRSGLASDKTRANLLYVNNSDGSFTESAEEFGLNDAGTSNQIYFLDFDLDGDLDAYVLNHPVDFENAYDPYFKEASTKDSIYSNRFYINNDGKFFESNQLLGLDIEKGFSLSASIGDVNRDGWPDIYVANDFISPDYLLINQKGQGFSNQISAYMSKTTLFSMGSDLADANNDGILDLFVADMEPGNHFRRKNNDIRFDKTYYDLVRNNFNYTQYSRNMFFLGTDYSFKEVGQMAGIAMTDWSWSTLFEDLDNDGLKDLYVTNGTKRDFHDMDYLELSFGGDNVDAQKQHDTTDLIMKMPISLISNHSFKNTNGFQFSNETRSWGLDTALNGQGAIIADLNNDGLLDIVINNTDAEASVFQNNSAEKNNYLRVKLMYNVPNQSAIGSQIRVWSKGNVQLKSNYTNRGFQSSTSAIIHFGLASATVDSLVINWPNGDQQVVDNPTINQTITVEYKPQSGKRFENKKRWLLSQNNLNKITHSENHFDEIQRDKIVPFGLSKPGPVLASADLTGNGLQDLIVGGSKDEEIRVFLQNGDGEFILSSNKFPESQNRETSALLILDIDNDGDNDFYSGNGGNEVAGISGALSDALYLNDGSGNFSVQTNPTSQLGLDTRALTKLDVNNDGWQDVIVGGGFIPGSYGKSNGSRILLNREGILEDATKQLAPDFLSIGATHAVVSVNTDDDEHPEIITAGPWEPVRIWRWTNDKFIPDEKVIAPAGLWNCLTLGDINGDNQPDIIAGNHGFNSIFRASEAEPLELFVTDFDNNGSQDQIVTHYLNGVRGTFVDKGEFCEKMPEFNNKFLTNRQFAEAQISDIVDGKNMDQLIHRSVTQLESLALINNGNGSFKTINFPTQAQESPVKTAVIMNITSESEPEILLFGNSNSEFYDQGDILASRGSVFTFQKGELKVLNAAVTGLNVYGFVNSSTIISDKGNASILLGRNDDSVVKITLR
ncbi:MAG: hypothetical protein ACJAYA_000239 [Bacteroidia bacterium]|jgi:hypothetical protein